jgi:hypothetical protein
MGLVPSRNQLLKLVEKIDAELRKHDPNVIYLLIEIERVIPALRQRADGMLKRD